MPSSASSTLLITRTKNTSPYYKHSRKKAQSPSMIHALFQKKSGWRLGKRSLDPRYNLMKNQYPIQREYRTSPFSITCISCLTRSNWAGWGWLNWNATLPFAASCAPQHQLSRTWHLRFPRSVTVPRRAPTIAGGWITSIAKIWELLILAWAFWLKERLNFPHSDCLATKAQESQSSRKIICERRFKSHLFCKQENSWLERKSSR